MRKLLSLVAAVVALLGLVASDALAQQPPAPKVTINGLVDNVTSWTSNLSVVDNNYDRTGDTEWYARMRARPDITAELGTTKFVLGLEIDYTWGATGAGGADGGAPTFAGPNRSGTRAGFDLNTDVAGIIEIKWAYTEFDLPWVPGARLRLGAQPFATTYKLAALATGDFAGAHFTWAATPGIRLNFTYAQIEEESTGPRDGFPNGEDWAFIASVEVSPFKGLDLRPIYAYFKADGTTSGSARQGRGGVANAAAVFPLEATETRHTIGLDARWKVGPFSLEPTIFYQFGERESAAGTADRSAWFLDVRGGWQAGPLLLEGAVIYTTGNKAGDNLLTGDIEYFEPINTDTSYYAGWAELWALGIDYFNILYSGAAGLNPGVAIGYDRYGLFRIGARASYALTPAFTLRAAANANWTAEKVDTDGTLAAASGITPVSGGDDRYLGTEVNLGFTYRFAPGVAFDMVGSYLWAGDALGHTGRSPNDVKAVTARVRYTF